jgi:signal transduction histidine kinase/CheY-like chemotaxis protein/HPt (histidine-containing phosphotransfer) domain-containing protein
MLALLKLIKNPNGTYTEKFWLIGYIFIAVSCALITLLLYKKTPDHFMMSFPFIVMIFLMCMLALYSMRKQQELIEKNKVIEHQINQKNSFEAQMQSHVKDLQKAHERAMKAISEAEKANMAKSEFLATMSHELRTPMNGIIGMAGMLEGTPLNDEQKEYNTIIVRSATSLLTIVNDILDLSKIEAGGIEIEQEAFPLRKIITDTIELFTPIAIEKGITLEADLGRTLPRFVSGDEGRVMQILRNLLGNSIKFTEKGSVKLVVKKEGDDIYFGITDTGIGIPENQQKMIFDKFTQANNTSSRKYGGTGLGLAITKQLVELMDGKIGVNSTIGQGSTFWFKLPLKECADNDNNVDVYTPRTQKTLKEVTMNRQAHILIAEDHPTNQFLVKRILTKHGFVHVDIVENGQQAVDAYNTCAYDIILMDGMMPDVDGYEATQVIREIEKKSKLHVPIIAMTANAMVGDREKCLDAGMDDYISKPVDAQKFLKLLTKWLPSIEGTEPKIEPSKTVDAPQNLPINIEHLESFTDGEPEIEKELFNIFIDQMGLGLTSLETYYQDKDQEAWRASAHKFKGAAANLGAEKLAALCFEAEHHFKDDEPSKKEILTAILHEADIVQSFIQQRVKAA